MTDWSHQQGTAPAAAAAGRRPATRAVRTALPVWTSLASGRVRWRRII